MGENPLPFPLVNPAPILDCIVCQTEFGPQDILLFRFDIKGAICSTCLEALSEISPRRSCFGKEGERGYSEEAPECSGACPDSVSCASWKEMDLAKKMIFTEEMRREAVRLFRQTNYEEQKRRKIETTHPFKKGTIMRIIWNRAEKGSTVEQIKSLCEEISARPDLYLRTLRREFANGHAWKFIEEEDGRIRVSNLHKQLAAKGR